MFTPTVITITFLSDLPRPDLHRILDLASRSSAAPTTRWVTPTYLASPAPPTQLCNHYVCCSVAVRATSGFLQVAEIGSMLVCLRTKSTLVLLFGVTVLLTVAPPLVAGQCAQDCICLRPTTICDRNPNQNLGSVERLTEIDPNSFINGDFVITLNLSSNVPLQLFSGSFNGLTNLQTLNLSSNGLRSPLPVALFRPLQSLRELDLTNNAFSFLAPSSLLGLNNLTTLRLSGNSLSIIPPSLITDLPALTTITLHPNPWDCNDDNITLLFQLVQSGLVTDSNQVRCANGTLVRDLDISVEVPTTTLPTTSFQITSSPPISPTSRVIPTPTPPPPPISPTSRVILTPTPPPPLISPMSRVIPTPTPLPPAPPCSSQTILSSKGSFAWPTTLAGKTASLTCPYGPLEKVATRACMASGLWDEVEDGDCATTQQLTEISQIEITMVTSVEVSSLLASLPPSTPLTLQELQTLTDIATQLVDTSGSNIQVLNNTLVALNTMLNSSGSILGNNTVLTHKLRDLIDTILLDALGTNHTRLVLTFSGLAVGGAYIPDTNHTHILATIHLNGGRVGVVIGGSGSGGDVEVDVNGASKGDTFQVTVYQDTDLFNEGACNDPPTLTTLTAGYTREGGEGVKGGEVVTPVVSVTHKVDGEEIFTLTFNNVQTRPEDSVVCARWNNTLNCGGGGWQTEGCQLIYSQGSTFRCQCQDKGTFAVIDIPSDGISHISRVVFYVFCSLTAPFYLTVAFTILVHKHLRTTPTMQCLVALSASQGLSLAVTAISFETAREMQVLCYSLGVIQHYFILLALAWLWVYPILMVVRVFRRMWYEKEWLIAPFAAFCIAIPGIPVAVYGGVRYATFPGQPDTCWFEGALFPSYFTYISGFVMLVAVTLIVGSMVLLKCSDYTVDSSAFRQLFSLLGNLVLYFATILCQFFTPTVQETSDQLLIVTALVAFLCSIYFFITNGLGKGRVRSALLCREDPILKAKLTHFKHNSSSFPSSNQNSRSSLHNFRRSPTRLVDEMNINYVDSYLGYPHTNPVPLAMLNQVQHAQGRRVKGDRKSGDLGYKNSAYQVAEGYTEV